MKKRNMPEMDRSVLECFDEYTIPPLISSGNLNGFRLMECYEEICTHIYILLKHGVIDTKLNTSGGKDFIFDGEYEQTLLEIISTTKDMTLKTHCLLGLAALSTMSKYAQPDGEPS